MPAFGAALVRARQLLMDGESKVFKDDRRATIGRRRGHRTRAACDRLVLAAQTLRGRQAAGCQLSFVALKPTFAKARNWVENRP